MKCHKCPHQKDVEAGKYKRVPFAKTPCAKCELEEVSIRTMEVDLNRPVYMPGGSLPGPEMPGESEVEEMKLPLRVMEEMVRRLLALPEELRLVVCWRFSGVSYPEIGRRQGITSAGAEARHRRAMEMFPELKELFIAKTVQSKMRRLAAERGPEEG
jgi:hypothetical protein